MLEGDKGDRDARRTICASAPTFHGPLLRCLSRFLVLTVVLVTSDQVIALGLPVPSFVGHPLDPPLRSRFQVRSSSIFQNVAAGVHLLAHTPCFQSILSLLLTQF